MRKIKQIKISLKSEFNYIQISTNSYWYHSIPKRANIHQFRISLTFRNMKPRKK